MYPNLDTMLSQGKKMIDGVILPVRVGEIVLPCIQVNFSAHFWVITAFEWVNLLATHVWVNNAVLNASMTCIPVNDTFQCINEFMAYLPVNVSIPKCMVVKLNCFVADVDTQKCNTVCLCHHDTMYVLSYHHDWPTFTEFQYTLWRAPTVTYEVVEYPFFIFHPIQHQFLNLGETLKLYAYYISQYRLIWVAEFIINWSSHLCHFVLQNMVLLVNFDLTPQQHCRNAHLTTCQSQYYKHDFAVILFGRNVSTNIVSSQRFMVWKYTRRASAAKLCRKTANWQS